MVKLVSTFIAGAGDRERWGSQEGKREKFQVQGEGISVYEVLTGN